ncbi:MAG: methyltransferase domain-containing protein, partial [Deltaproteobacteria bacterium]|nr:methyltransferase domain-containing protein [Deltaproteobacteria bacterium]
DDTFQVVFSVVGLIFFPDRKKGLDEMFRVLEPGGACGDRGLGIPPKVSFHQFTHALHTADGARFFTQEKSGV